MFTGIVEGTGIIRTPASAEAHRLVSNDLLARRDLPIAPASPSTAFA